MVKITVTDTAGDSREINAEEGITLMESIRENDFDDLAAICGGCCSCCTCHVQVEGDWMEKLPARGDDEAYLLEDSPKFDDSSSRLSCQIEVTADLEGLSVTIVEES